jgi:hypothetical protein
MATTLGNPGCGRGRAPVSLRLKVLTKQRPEIIRDRDAMVLSRAFESNGDGLSCSSRSDNAIPSKPWRPLVSLQSPMRWPVRHSSVRIA